MKVIPLSLVFFCFACQSMAVKNYVISTDENGVRHKYENAYGSIGCGSFIITKHGERGVACPTFALHSDGICKSIPGNPRSVYPGCCSSPWCPPGYKYKPKSE